MDNKQKREYLGVGVVLLVIFVVAWLTTSVLYALGLTVAVLVIYLIGRTVVAAVRRRS